MKKKLHYELILGIYKINHIVTRKMALLPVTFLVLVDSTGESPFKKDSNVLLQNLIRNQIIRNSSMIEALSDHGEPVLESLINVSEVELYYRKNELYKVDALISSAVYSCFDNMFIEVIDNNVENSDYFVFSTNRRWNLIAIRYAMQPAEACWGNTKIYSILELAFDGIFKYEAISGAIRRIRDKSKEIKSDLFDIESVYQDSYVCLRKDTIEVPIINEEVLKELNNNPNFSFVLSESQWALVDWALFIYYNVGLDDVSIRGDEYTMSDRVCLEGQRSFVLLSSYEKVEGCSLSTVPLIEIKRTDDGQNSIIHFMWSKYTPFYLNTIGVYKDYEIEESIEIESIWCLFHAFPKNN